MEREHRVGMLMDPSDLGDIPLYTCQSGREFVMYSVLGRIAGQPQSPVRIFRADHQESGRPCVLKVFDKSSLGAERMATVVAGTVIHASLCPFLHIVALNAVIESPNLLVMELEYCPYGDLFAVVSSVGKLPSANALSVILQVCDALAYIHARGFVHRDIKPENIMVDARGLAKLADFDLATRWQPGRMMDRYCGTTEYAAPEMLFGIPYVGPEVDIWSLGVTLYVLLHRRFPFPHSFYLRPTFEETLRFRDSLSSPTIASIIQGCLNPSRSQRWGGTILRNVLVEALCSEVGIAPSATSAADVSFNFSDSGTSESSVTSSYSVVSTRSTNKEGLKQARELSRKVSTRSSRGATKIRGVLRKLVSKAGGDWTDDSRSTDSHTVAVSNEDSDRASHLSDSDDDSSAEAPPLYWTREPDPASLPSISPTMASSSSTAHASSTRTRINRRQAVAAASAAADAVAPPSLVAVPPLRRGGMPTSSSSSSQSPLEMDLTQLGPAGDSHSISLGASDGSLQGSFSGTSSLSGSGRSSRRRPPSEFSSSGHLNSTKSGEMDVEPEDIIRR